MASNCVIAILELCLTLTVSTSVLNYKEFPMCPVSAVCSEIYGVSIQGFGPAYVNYVNCKCPRSYFCPSVPGSQTLDKDFDKWYGLCQPVDEIPKCQTGEIAEEVIINSPEFEGRTYTKVQCICPRQNLIYESSAAPFAGTDHSQEKANYVHRLICSDYSISKRGPYRSRFYFYRK